MKEDIINLLRRAWDALDSFKQAYPENWHEEDQAVLDDLIKADNAIASSQDPMPLFDDWPGGWGKTIPTLNGREVCIGLVRVEGSTKDRPGWVFKDTGQPVELSDLPDDKTKKRDPRMPNFAPRKRND